MVRNSLRVFIPRVLQKGRIDGNDIAILNDILQDGFASRDEVAALLSLDQQLASTDPAWVEYLATAVTEFVVWSTRPTGQVDASTARWLVASLSCEPVSPNATRIAREIVQEALLVDRL